MSFSESLSATHNIGELERRLRSINPQETSAEDALIVELAGGSRPSICGQVSKPFRSPGRRTPNRCNHSN
jgi:hypothetical protein